jgi:hypothetical protein
MIYFRFVLFDPTPVMMTDNDKPQKTKQPEEEKPAEQATRADTDPTPVAPPTEPNPESSQDEGFDFGGLPARNLKKNLGCGG